MKKVLLFIISLLLFIPAVRAAEINKPKVTNHEKVNIYLFWASWCPHCHDFINYFSDKYDEYDDYFDIITYQLDSESEIENISNNQLLSAVREEVKNDSSGIPFIIVGKWYQVGFGLDGSNIIEEALNAYQSTKYVDVVKSVSNSKELTGYSNTFDKSMAIINNEETSIDDELDTAHQENNSNSIFNIIIDFIRYILRSLLNII